jgi:hypothetical protein
MEKLHHSSSDNEVPFYYIESIVIKSQLIRYNLLLNEKVIYRSGDDLKQHNSTTYPENGMYKVE